MTATKTQSQTNGPHPTKPIYTQPDLFTMEKDMKKCSPTLSRPNYNLTNSRCDHSDDDDSVLVDSNSNSNICNSNSNNNRNCNGTYSPSSSYDDDDSSLEIIFTPKSKKQKHSLTQHPNKFNNSKKTTAVNVGSPTDTKPAITIIDLSYSPPPTLPLIKSSIQQDVTSFGSHHTSRPPSNTGKTKQQSSSKIVKRIKLSSSSTTSTTTTTTTQPPSTSTAVGSHIDTDRPRNTTTSANHGRTILSASLGMSYEPYDFSSSSEDDHDDQDILVAQPTFETRDQTKKRQRQQLQQRQRQVQKQAKARQRQEEKEAREQQKERNKAAKKREYEAFNQSAGKYKHDEIVILMDPQLYVDDPVGLVRILSEDFLVHSYPSKLSMTPAAIQFVRKDYLEGGGKRALECLEKGNRDGYQHIPDLVLLIDPPDFIPMLQRQDKTEDDDFPRLEAWLIAIKSTWRRIWNVPSHIEPRLLILLRNVPEALDKMWVAHRRRTTTETSLPTAGELADAIQWLLVQFQVECMHCSSFDLIQAIVHKMARALCEKPYKSLVTELECVRKVKQGPIGISNNDSAARATDIWFRQLQSIPCVSETMAQNVVQQYPTCQTLWQAYQRLLLAAQDDVDNNNNDNNNNNLHHQDAALLLANVLTAGKNCQQKLSRAVFRIMTSNNPEEMIL
jgi:hypothetical protein